MAKKKYFNKRKLIWIGLSIIISIVLLIVLIQHIKIQQIFEIIKSIPLTYLILGFIAYVIAINLNTLKFHLILNRKIKLKKMVSFMPVYNFLANVMPARTGELSFFYFTKKNKVRISESLAGMIFSKVIDTIAIFILFVVSFFFIKNPPELIRRFILPLAICCIIAIAFIIVYILYGNRIVQTFKNKFRKKIIVSKLFKWAYEQLKGFAAISDAIKKSRRLPYILICSLLYWASIYAFYFLILIKMNSAFAEFTFWMIVMVITVHNLAMILPIQGIAAIGVYEGAWALIMMAFGVIKETAISSGFAMHIIFISFSLVYGVISLILMRVTADRTKKRKK